MMTRTAHSAAGRYVEQRAAHANWGVARSDQ